MSGLGFTGRKRVTRAMICPFCGNPLLQGRVPPECPLCRRKLAILLEREDGAKCPTCLGILVWGAIFCHHCSALVPGDVDTKPAMPAQVAAESEWSTLPDIESQQQLGQISQPVPASAAVGSAISEPVQASQAVAVGATASMSEIIMDQQQRSVLDFKSGIIGTISWFALANIAVMGTLVIIAALSGPAILAIWPVILTLGCISPFFGLLISKWLAQTSHNMRRASATFSFDDSEGKLIELVNVLARRAGLARSPEVWIYHSEDMNAFATGPSRNSALIAVSDALLSRVDSRGMSAIVAHEIAHIANGDMLTLTIVQSAVNAISMIILIPLWIMNFMAPFFSGCLGEVGGCYGWLVGTIGKWVMNILAWIISSIVLVLGLLVVMFFSRKREYAADALAAKLVDPDSMIHALRTLESEVVVTPIEQRAFAAFKINDSPAWLVLFSTHPTIEARVMRLQQMAA